MTEPLFFDTDCISAFLWVDQESILSKLFPGRIIIPKEVYDELSHPKVNYLKGLKAQVDVLIHSGEASVETIMAGYINETQGNAIWANMLARRRKLGYESFSAYLKAADAGQVGK